MHVPADDPVPVPHELLSQSPFLWHVAALVVHVALQLPLSHWLFWLHAFPLVLQVPAVEPVPVPQAPPEGQSALLWQNGVAEHPPTRPAPPHAPLPQSAFLWHAIELHVPPWHVPFPHCAVDVHEIGEQVIEAQAPPLQSALPVHVQVPLTHERPVPHWALVVQAFCPHVPEAAPEHVKLEFGQSALVPHGSEHCPTAPWVAPMHVAVKPQSASLRH